MNSRLTIAALQMSSQDDLTANLSRASALIRASRARVILLPENFAFMGREEDKRSLAESIDGDGPIVSFLREEAKASDAFLIAGGLPERSEDPRRPYNTSVVVDPGGAIVTRYRKIHLFDVEVGDGASYRESGSTSAGAEVVVAPIEGVNFGLSICYDLRFPELYRALVDRGARVLTVPAAFTLQTGKDHWHVLLRARAIESQCYVIAAAQWGSHPGARKTFGKACIIDAWGDVISQAEEGEGMALSSIDLEKLDRVRASLPSLKHRAL